MSQNQDEIVTDDATECLLDTNAIIQTTTKVHRIRWATENFSKLPLDAIIFGPYFFLTKTCLCTISIRKKSAYVYVFLHHKSDKTIKIEHNLILFDCKGTALHHDKMGSVTTLEKNMVVDIISSPVEINRFNSLQDDILVIDCCLKMKGSFATEMSFFNSEIESREHFIKDLETMFNNPVDSDITLQVGNEFIYAHKALLRARSAYFKRMFETEMEESDKNSVLVSDVTYPTMLKLVQFLYTAGFTESFEYNNIQQISDLHFAADKYEMMDLRALCGDKLMSVATADNICQILQLAKRHNDEDLKIQAMNFVFLHLDRIGKLDAWNTFISSELDLASEVLNFCSEKLKLVS